MNCPVCQSEIDNSRCGNCGYKERKNQQSKEDQEKVLLDLSVRLHQLDLKRGELQHDKTKIENQISENKQELARIRRQLEIILAENEVFQDERRFPRKTTNG